MQTFISSDFWSDQIAAAFNAWAILIALILLCWTALKIKLAITNKQLRTFQAYTETVEVSITVGSRT